MFLKVLDSASMLTSILINEEQLTASGTVYARIVYYCALAELSSTDCISYEQESSVS